MDESFLTNRELASLLTLLIFALVVVIASRRDSSRTDLSQSFRGLLSSIFDKKIILSVLAYLGWIAIALSIAALTGIWDFRLIKGTVVWFLLSGLGLMGKGSDAVSRDGVLWPTLKRLIGVILLVEFVANLASFPLYVEIPAQLLAALFGITAVLAQRESADPRVRLIANRYLIVLGLAAIGWSVRHTANRWSDLDRGLFWLELLLPVWLSVAAMLFIYLFAVYMAYESAFSLMRAGEGSSTTQRTRLAVLLRCSGRLRHVRAVRPRAMWLGNTVGFRETWRVTSRMLKETKNAGSDPASTRPAWCLHYDVWKRAYDASEELKAANSEFTADWTREDLGTFARLTTEFGEAAFRMREDAPDSETWESAHFRCGG